MSIKSPSGVQPLPHGGPCLSPRDIYTAGPSYERWHLCPAWFSQVASGACVLAICRLPAISSVRPDPEHTVTRELTLVTLFSTCSQAGLEKENSQCPSPGYRLPIRSV